MFKSGVQTLLKDLSNSGDCTLAPPRTIEFRDRFRVEFRDSLFFASSKRNVCVRDRFRDSFLCKF